jgi:hypothetical protein
MLEWLDGRNGSAFTGLAWSGNTLSFGISVGAGARNLQALAPMVSAVGRLTGLRRDGAPSRMRRRRSKAWSTPCCARPAGPMRPSVRWTPRRR